MSSQGVYTSSRLDWAMSTRTHVWSRPVPTNLNSGNTEQCLVHNPKHLARGCWHHCMKVCTLFIQENVHFGLGASCLVDPVYGALMLTTINNVPGCWLLRSTRRKVWQCSSWFHCLLFRWWRCQHTQACTHVHTHQHTYKSVVTETVNQSLSIACHTPEGKSHSEVSPKWKHVAQI